MTLIAEFEILGLPVMTNGQASFHWTQRHREAKKWKSLVFDMCVFHRICGLHLEKAVVTLTRHSNREPDNDGLVSGFKHVVDGLVLAGVIEDDKPSVLTRHHKWEYVKVRQGKITVRIEDPLDLDLNKLGESIREDARWSEPSVSSMSPAQCLQRTMSFCRRRR